MTSLPFLHDIQRLPERETVRKAVKPAAGANNEDESRLLNALRRQPFGSASTLAAFVKRGDAETREVLNDLIARNLVVYTSDSLGVAGSGYRAVPFEDAKGVTGAILGFL